MALRPANRAWGTSRGVIKIVDGHKIQHNILALVPLSFISSSNLDARYLFHVLSCLVEEQDLVLELEGANVEKSDRVEAGMYFAFSAQSEFR